MKSGLYVYAHVGDCGVGTPVDGICFDTMEEAIVSAKHLYHEGLYSSEENYIVFIAEELIDGEGDIYWAMYNNTIADNPEHATEVVNAVVEEK